MPLNIEEIENEVAELSIEFEAVDRLIIEYSTTNVIKQAPNVAEATFAISGIAYESDRMPQSAPATETTTMITTPAPTMRSGY